MGVSDEMIAAAASAYNSAAVAEGFHSVIPSLDATHLRWMRAALLAALPHMQPSAEDTIAQVGDPVGFVCGHCGAAHKEEPFLAHIDRKQREARTTQPAPVDVRLRKSTLRQAIHAMRRCQQESRSNWQEYIDDAERYLALLSAQPSADAGDGAMAQDAARYRWVREHATQELTPESMKGDPTLGTWKTQWVMPPLVSYADFCGPITLDEAIDYKLEAISAIAAQREAGEG